MKNLIYHKTGFKIQISFFLFIILLLGACGDPSTTDDESKQDSFDEEAIIIDDEKVVEETINDSNIVFQAKFDDYIVTLDVDKHMKLNQKGELKVWIGTENFKPKILEHQIHDETEISTHLGHYAKVIPHAPDFTVEPKSSKCIKIDSTGSTARFVLTPTKLGKNKVSAIVELYEENNCMGSPVPKSSEDLTVVVKVGGKDIIIDKLIELVKILWDKFIIFWGTLIALIFAIIIIIIRRKIKRKTGIDINDENLE